MNCTMSNKEYLVNLLTNDNMSDESILSNAQYTQWLNVIAKADDGLIDSLLSAFFALTSINR